MTITITIPGIPQGKGRARSATRRKKGGGSYIAHVTPQKTVNYESLVAMAAQQAMAGRAPLEGAVEVEIALFVTPPASWSSKKREQALAGVIKPIAGRGADIDNYMKSLFDGCNGVVFVDDKQVTDVVARKRYAETASSLMIIRGVA